VAFAKRLRDDEGMRDEVDAWLEAPATRPEGVRQGDWLSWEQEKHERLLALAEVA
jgi:hypothetical protein